jgi:hypothetical protein
MCAESPLPLLSWDSGMPQRRKAWSIASHPWLEGEEYVDPTKADQYPMRRSLAGRLQVA